MSLPTGFSPTDANDGGLLNFFPTVDPVSMAVEQTIIKYWYSVVVRILYSM